MVMAPVASTNQSDLKTSAIHERHPALATTPKAAAVATSDQGATPAVIRDDTEPPYGQRGMLERSVCIISDGTLAGLGDELHRISQGRWSLRILENDEALSVEVKDGDNSCWDDIIYVTSGIAFWPTKRNNLTQIMENIDDFDVVKTCVVFLGTAEFWATTRNNPIHDQNKAFFTDSIIKLSEKGIRTTVVNSAFMNTLVWKKGYVAKESNPALLTKLSEVFQAFVWRKRLPSIVSIMQERQEILRVQYDKRLAEQKIFFANQKQEMLRTVRRSILFAPEDFWIKTIGLGAKERDDAEAFFGMFDEEQ
jgi:hypothetical protein